MKRSFTNKATEVEALQIIFVINALAVAAFAITNNALLGIAGVGLSAILILNTTYALPTLLYYSFLDHDLTVVLGNYPIIWLLLLFVCVLILRKFSGNHATTVNRYQLLIVTVAALITITAIMTSSIFASYYRDVIVLLLILLLCSTEPVDAGKIIDLVIQAASFAALYFFVNNLINPVNIAASRYAQLTTVNVNSISYSCMQILCILLISVLTDRVKTTRYMLLALSLFLLYLLLGYSSRTALITTILTVLVALYIVVKKGTRANTIIKIMLVAVAGLYLLSTFEWSAETLGRLSFDSIRQDGGSNRFVLWGVLVQEIIPRNALFGIGLNPENLRIALAAVQSPVISGYAHNFLLGLFTQTGLVCGSMIVLTIIRSLRGISRIATDHALMILMTLVFSTLVTGLGESTQFYRNLWIGMAMIQAYCHSVST